jgi:hypothetical protein
MTNNTDTDLTAAAIKASTDRRLAAIRADKATPTIMVPKSGKVYRRRTRRTSVPHRAIR